MQRHLSRRRCDIVPLLLTAPLLLMAQAPAPQTPGDPEVEIGTAVFEELRDAGEIIAASPLYDALAPVTTAITRVAQPRYDHPLKFIIVHEASPNAFSAPGGTVYITDSLLRFVKNTEELADTLCHELAHTIHHDATKRIEDSIKTRLREFGAAILLGTGLGGTILIQTIGDLHSARYSRDIESAADITGSDICAAAGYNPWGMIWLFQDFEKADPDQVPELLADHPSFPTRIRSLQDHFRADPALFSRFSPDQKSATALRVPKNASEQLLRPNAQ